MTNVSCIFTVVKNEHEYLDDWIKYHQGIGVNYIFIFEDIDSDTHKPITDKYDNVTLHSVNILFNSNDEILELKEGEKFQGEYIKRGLLWVKEHSDCDWCFSLDADEYITVNGELSEVLGRFVKHDAIMLQWKNYGCSGYIKKPKYDKPIYEIYTEECGFSKLDKKLCNCTKMCFNLKKLQERFIFGNHTALCNYVKPDFSHDRTKTVFGDIYIRHYITKSFEEYMWKLNKRGMMCKSHRKIDDFFEMHPQLENKREEMLKEVKGFG